MPHAVMPLSLHQSSHRALAWALGLSLVLHALLLTVKWVSPATFDRMFETNTLEVVLVNSRSKNAPDTALALAQVNLAGGGNASGSGLQTSPYSVQTDPAQTPELQQVEQKIEALKNEQQRLVQQLQQALFQLSSESPLAKNSPTNWLKLKNSLSHFKAVRKKDTLALQPKKFRLHGITTKCDARLNSLALKISRKLRVKNSMAS
jgi:hypothetical protein